LSRLRERKFVGVRVVTRNKGKSKRPSQLHVSMVPGTLDI
jgi:hypothetical protein